MPNHDPFEITAPPPGAVFYEQQIHPDNVALLEGDERARKLSRGQLKTLKSRLQECDKLLTQYDEQVTLRTHLRETFNNAKALAVGCEDPQELKRLRSIGRECRAKIKRITQRIEPLKHIATLRNRMKQRLQEHEVAVKNQLLYDHLQKEMEREVDYFMQQIIRRWAALGYKEELHRDGKTRIRYVQMEEVHVTEDEIMYKVRASRVTLWGSTQHFIPYQTRVQDLVKPETLAELSAVCERPVTSPHNPQEFGGEDKDFSNGAWVVVHRIGMNGGLFNYIELSSVLRKYNQANRHQFPIPFGVRRGRKINYCKLNEHPHIFIDGQTFAGKTNALRVAVCTLIQMHSPDELRMVLVDLKRGGDFNPFAHVPHLMTFDEGTIIKTPEYLANVLERIVKLMQTRMQIISEVTVDIEKFNEKVGADRQLPRIVVIIDEYSATTMDREAKKRIDHFAIILSTQARAAGIHIVIGNQQPYADIVPKEVKGNITFKLAGRQMTQGASMSALGSGRATRIDKIPGRMVCNNGHEEFDVQIPYVTEADIAIALKIANDKPAPQHDVWLMDDTQEIQPLREMFSEKLLIRLALNEFNGTLAGRNIWERLKQMEIEISRDKVLATVKSIVDRGAIEFEGITYRMTKPGNRYVLLPVTSELPENSSVLIQEIDQEVIQEDENQEEANA